MGPAPSNRKICPVCGSEFPRSSRGTDRCEECGTDLRAAGLAAPPSPAHAPAPRSAPKHSVAPPVPKEAGAARLPGPAAWPPPVSPPPGPGGFSGLKGTLLSALRTAASRIVSLWQRCPAPWRAAAILFLTFLFVFGRPGSRPTKPKPTPAPKPATPVVVHFWVSVNVPTANIRAAPTTEAQIIARAHSGDRLGVLGAKNRWYQVALPGNTTPKMTGWIYGKLVTRNFEPTTRVPQKGFTQSARPRPIKLAPEGPSLASPPTPLPKGSPTPAPTGGVPSTEVAVNRSPGPPEDEQPSITEQQKANNREPTPPPPSGAPVDAPQPSARQPEEATRPQPGSGTENELGDVAHAVGIWQGDLAVEKRRLSATLVLLGDGKGNLWGSMSIAPDACRMAVRSLTPGQNPMFFWAEPEFPESGNTCARVRRLYFQFRSPWEAWVEVADRDGVRLGQGLFMKRHHGAAEPGSIVRPTPTPKYPSPRRW